MRSSISPILALTIFLNCGSLTFAGTPIMGIAGTSLQYCNPSQCESDRDFGGTLDLASDPNSPSIIWATTQAFRANDEIELVRIDTQTNGLERMLLPTDQPIYGLAIDETNTFFGATNAGLIRIYPDTGQLESIGANDYGNMQGSPLASHPDGMLYGIRNSGSGPALVSIDKATAEVTTVIEFQTDDLIDGLAIDPDSLEMHALGRDNLYKVDLTSGSLIVDDRLSPSRSRGLAFAAVPEPSSFDLSFLMVLFVLAKRSRSSRQSHS